jgi:signal transduction histidine kinase
MNRHTQLLLGATATVGVTLLAAWLAVLVFVIQPGVAAEEASRVVQTHEAARLLQSGVSKREIEVSRGIDLRLLQGQAPGPPPGGGWERQQTAEGTHWRREGGNHELAVWTGQTWVVLQAHPPHAVTLAIALGAVGVPLVLLAFGAGRRAGRPQEEAEERLRRIAGGDLTVRLDPATGTQEVRAVAVAVNQMATQLSQLLQADRQRMAGLSHELRTPLTRIRLELELARREGASVPRLDRVERDIERFDELLRELLELSQLELVGEAVIRRELVELEGLVRCVLDEENWDDVELRGHGTAWADSQIIARLIRNLLQNSTRHAPGCRRWVEVGDGLLRVGDDGPGIPLDAQAEAVQPFRRGASSEGHGLGLAIVARIVALHGGTLELSAPPGLTVEARLGSAPG